MMQDSSSMGMITEDPEDERLRLCRYSNASLRDTRRTLMRVRRPRTIKLSDAIALQRELLALLASING
jgi:hypothetical protein